MIELTGISLGVRRKELNFKINDALKNKGNFNDIKTLEEKSDVDKIYKIGVASKYKNVEYIIETLKSGDSLYISKALKCVWLYSDEYSDIINPEYLDVNLFPLMSLKMIKKLLTTISNYVKDLRAVDFYNYCIREKHTNIAMKFLIFTPEAFKLERLKDAKVVNYLKLSDETLRNFLGNSYNLAEVYFNTAPVDPVEQVRILHQLRYFYFISGVKYLEILKKCNFRWNDNIQRLGLRISKDIIKRHKDEIYKNPIIYLFLLNKSILTKHNTIADAKLFAKILIAYHCPKASDFWYSNFCSKYSYILNKIPFEERLQFIKDIFTAQYPLQEFETTKHFYDAQLYKLMTPEEREKWALTHVERGLELLGSGQEFLWYRFVSFDKALIAIKKYIQVAVDVNVRTQIVAVLIESAKTESELETLFDYYYKRHVNEQRYYKEHFVDALLLEHRVYEFSDKCWEAFNQILHSLDVYNTFDIYACKTVYKNVALIYHIIHRKEVPEALTKYIDFGIVFYELKTETDKLTQANIDIVYQYVLQYYLNKIKSFGAEVYNDDIKFELNKYIVYVLDFMHTYSKKRKDVPDIIIKYVQLHCHELKNHILLKEPNLYQRDLIRYVKKDKDLVVSKLPIIKESIMSNGLQLNIFVKLLRTYFSNDLATIFLNMCKEILVETSGGAHVVGIAVYIMFELADVDFIKEFMAKHVPTDGKIDHKNIDQRFLNIQKSICQFACYSRPPVAFSDIMKYIKGDYVQFCLPMFNLYLAKLPKPLCLEFVQLLLDKPLSVQKHGLRMAFECFKLGDLRKIILEVWKKSKNVSLRSIIYASVYNKIKTADENTQNELFEDLKLFTRTLHEEDDKEIFTLITSDGLPKRFVGEYIEIVWNVVDSLPVKIVSIQHRTNVIDCMKRNIYLLRKETVESIIEKHVDHMLKQEQIKDNYGNDVEMCLVNSKWSLLHKYVTYFKDNNDFHKKSEIVNVVIKESIRLWDKVDNEKYILKKFVTIFIREMDDISYSHDVNNYAKTNKLFELIIKKLQDSLCNKVIYEINWYIRVSNLTRNVLIDVEQNFTHHDRSIKIDNAISYFVKEFHNLLVDSVESGQCYVAFIDKIKNIVTDNLERILISFKFDGNFGIKIKCAYVLLCSNIINYATFETYMFASKLLPCDTYDSIYRAEYLNVLNKLRSYENDEIQCYLYRKFITDNDFICRNYKM